MAIVKAQAVSSSLSSPPPSLTSSSTSKSSYTYDVFLSFRGEDTRKNFSDHLYAALVNKGFRTFRDNDQMHMGKSLKTELDKAIKQSRVSIIVFSKDYASSTWCLDELVMILDRKRTSEHDVLPVFYDLSPSENLKSLKILDLSYSASLVKTPNFLGVPKLEKLILEACVSLIDCESIEILQKLILLDLTYCKNLRKLPNNIHKLGSLETLIAGCSNLFIGGNEISATQPRRGPEMLWASLPHSLVRLSLVRCNLFDDSLPLAFSNLSRLKYLDLRVNLFRSLPECIKGLSSLQWLSLASCQSLSSILGLPSNLQYLDVSSLNVMPLRRITFQSTPDHLNEIHTFCCCNLVEIEGILKREPIEKVDRRIIKNLGIDIESIKNLKGIYEFGIFNTFIPGGKIPICFQERKKGSSMSFTVPKHPKSRIQCLNICSVYVAGFASYCWGGIKINNKTKDLTWVYIPMYFGIQEKDREECFRIIKEYRKVKENEYKKQEMKWFSQGNFKKEMTWFSQWNFGNQLESGDEIVISVLLEDWLEVKECAINIVYEEEEDNGVVTYDNNDKPYFHWNEVVGGDLSRFQLRTGMYFLRRRLYEDEIKLKGMEEDLNLFGDIASLEDMQKLKVRCGIQPEI
ncbi:hypothetical protein LguiB_020918 [Lonicera macranthoides]